MEACSNGRIRKPPGFQAWILSKDVPLNVAIQEQHKFSTQRYVCVWRLRRELVLDNKTYNLQSTGVLAAPGRARALFFVLWYPPQHAKNVQ